MEVQVCKSFFETKMVRHELYIIDGTKFVVHVHTCTILETTWVGMI